MSAFKKIYTSKFASKLRNFVTIWLYIMHFFAFYWTDCGSIGIFIPENIQKDTIHVSTLYSYKDMTNKKYVLWNMVSAPQPSSQVHDWTVCIVTEYRPRWRFLILIFQDGGRLHLGFLKFQIFNGRDVPEVRIASCCQISSKSVELRRRYGYF